MDASLPAGITEKINEISLLLVMTSPDDEIGVGMLCELFDAVAEEAGQHLTAEPLAAAWHRLKAKRGSMQPQDFSSLLNNLLQTATQFCDNPDAALFADFCSEPQSSPSPLADELKGIDLSFLPEFIETHSMQLEELESWLLDCEFKSDSGEDISALVKRYIHSLKGDAGAIGLRAIERAAHCVEDILQNSSVPELMAQLMLFREWVLDYMRALRSGTPPPESAEQFIERMRKACSMLQCPDAKAPSDNNEPNPAPPPLSRADAAGANTYALSGERDIFQEFVAEAQEHLGNVEGLILDADGNFTKDAIDTVFRGVHSLKGGSAYFNFREMTETSHLLENLLDEVRDGKRELDQQLCALVLSYIDLQKNLLRCAKEALSKDGIMTSLPASAEFLAAIDDFKNGSTHAQPTRSAQRNEPLEAIPSPAAPPAMRPVLTQPSTADSPASTKPDAVDIKTFVKVDTQRLDHLIDSIGEMVIYSSMLIRRCREVLAKDEELVGITHRVEKFARDLQDVGMSMRLVPIKGLFQKMSRLVWDTSKKIKKEISFSMDGEDTELDRNLIDKLADPLMHMVRNALDHGIEPPEEREKCGKPRSGKVHLSASHSGGSILIRITDDGRGLNPEKLLAKAREKGIVTEHQKLSEQEIFQLIFAPGFSTAAAVTDISGRGVGMDVVRKNVEGLRGRIHIDSTLGKGTLFTIELPLTLAIVDGVEVSVGTEHFIIPSLAIVEFLKPRPEHLSRTLDRGETFFFRGKYLPVFKLSQLFDIDPDHESAEDATIVVVENHQELIALMVDEIIGELSTVIKSLGTLFSDVQGVSGCAVMPNGDVALILDIRSLAQLARKQPPRSVPRTTSSGHPVP